LELVGGNRRPQPSGRDPRGTAYYILANLPYKLAGKTGTTTTPTGGDNSDAWFAGYTEENRPNQPDIAVVVLLVACIQSGLDLRSGRISSAIGKGIHTTEVRELYCLSEGVFIADMSGLRVLTLWNIQPEELDGYFPEMRKRIDACQYNDCSHHSEPGCSIHAAVLGGRIHPDHYKS
ncbi:MAG: penicillin-binding transpeptidase domain-containing protein, partial [Anaerolineaceae bacterium]